jgi:flagellar hook assembly protein FlgD
VLSEGQEGFALVFKDDGNGHLKFAAARTHGNSEDGLFATFNFTNVIHLENNEETLVSMESFKLNSNLDVSVETIAIVSINQELAMPTQFILKQNYPNPFNPTTTIGYGLPESSDVSIIIYDVKGREVMNLVQTTQSAGWYDVSWKGMTNTNKQVSTGVYFARIQAGTFSDVIKMVYLR